MRAPLPVIIVAVTIASLGALPASPAAATQRIPTVADLRLDQLLGTASARVGEYFSLFKDLTAEETKLVEQIESSGATGRRRRIVSNLIIYTSQLDNGSVSEYRDVLEVDGAPVEGRERRVQALFESKGRNVRDELARVNKEGARYDLDYTVSGLTLVEGLPVQPWARSLFDFSEAGTDRIEGRPALVVAYAQAVPDARFGFKLSLPSEVRNAPPLYRGRIWLDAETSQILRETRDVTVGSPASQLLVQRIEFEYGAERFGVQLPTRIIFTSYGHFDSAGGRMTSSPRYRLTFSYGEFRRFSTSSDEGEIARVAPDDSGEPLHPDAELGPEFGEGAPTSGAEPATGASAPPRATAASLGPYRYDTDLPPSVPSPQRPEVHITPPPRPPAPGDPVRRPPPS